MARQEIHSGDMPIEQMPPIVDTSTYDGDVVLVDKIGGDDYAKELAFGEEPVKIRIEPSSDKNAATAFPVWCNGQRAQVFQNGRWDEIGYLPVGVPLIVKRKILEIILRAKVDRIETDIQGQELERPNNRIARFTTPIHSLSILRDDNPRGAAWATEIRRRNL